MLFKRIRPGSTVFEYHLVLTPPNVGDDIDHIVTILAWDDEGNSTFRKLILPYHRVGEGDENGSIHISIDATTLGLGIIIDDDYTVHEGRKRCRSAAAPVRGLCLKRNSAEHRS